MTAIQAAARQAAHENLQRDLIHALESLLAETTGGPDEMWAPGTAVENARAVLAKAKEQSA
ncbi:hypothetical protein CBM2599_A120531 [Cupriavidus taiwanensis]|uniref:hypothetical protein n=1 Tax=Cupriavidus taiwanensis TaxID=164546 RepID=UPI000E14F3FB|nr:hypothetical protein [Cupriavidus taiwanensis]SOY79966.1 hypothetical protein CBM2599_A120531 [Cupriavidus taiwanensis]SOY81935.1 hypothetical protein CBM2600_A120553 [Cupriavidus taiwanensis]